MMTVKEFFLSTFALDFLFGIKMATLFMEWQPSPNHGGSVWFTARIENLAFSNYVLVQKNILNCPRKEEKEITFLADLQDL